MEQHRPLLRRRPGAPRARALLPGRAGCPDQHERHVGRQLWQRAVRKDAAGSVLVLDPTGTLGTSVGSEIDLTYRYAWTGATLLEGGWSRFSPGRFARLIRGDDVSRRAYLMVTFAF